MVPGRIAPPLIALVLAATAAGAGETGPTFRAEAAVSSTVAAGERLEISVRLTNTGPAAWTADRPIRLASHWLDGAGDPVVWDGRRTPLPLPVPAGGTVEVVARVDAPDEAGTYRFQWDVVEEGVRWFGRGMDPPPPTVAVTVLPRPRRHVFELVRAAWPLVIPAGGERRIRVTVKNAGDAPWEEPRRINLAYHWLRRDGRMRVLDGERTDIPLPVAPGESVTVAARLKAPRSGGLLRLQWDVVEEGVCWFGQRMDPPPPSRTVLVVPLMPVAIALLALLVLWAWRRLLRSAGRPARLLALADILWFVTALLVKQAWVMAQAPPLPGQRSLLLWAAPVFLLALLALGLPQKVRPWILLALGTAASLVFWGDVVFMRYFQGLPSLALIDAAGQTGQVTESIAALLRRGDLWLLADLIPAALLARAVARVRPAGRWRLGAALLLAVGSVPFALWTVHAAVAATGRDVQRFSSLQLARRIGVTGYHLVDAWGELREAVWSATVSREQVERVAALLQARRPLREGRGPLFGAGRGMNVVLLQVESLQGFMIDLDVGGQPVMPTLRRLAREGVSFELCTDQTAYGRTSDAELLTETSLLPVAHGATCFRHGDDRFVALARVLGREGYATLSAVPFLGRFWNRRVTHPAYGFARSLFARDFAPGRKIGWGLDDRDFLAQMLDRLQALPRPFLAYTITLSLHHPFEGFPKDLEELDVGRWEGTPFGGYVHAMHFFDTALAGFLEGLQQRGLDRDTILVVWGDHDAGFGRKPELATVVGFPDTELGWTLQDRVPLVVHVPGASAPHGVIVHSPVGLWDVPPTVAALVGIDPGPLPWLGRNLAVGAGEGPVVRQHGGWIDARLLWTGTASGRCFEWRTGRSLPAEACAESTERARRIVAASDLILRADLQQRLETILEGGER